MGFSLKTSASVDERVQALAQELQDIILDLLVTSPPPGTIVIDRDYKPPGILHINRATRAKATEHFYTTHIFQCVVPENEYGYSPELLVSWLAALTDEHRAHLAEVRVKSEFSSCRCGLCLDDALSQVEEVLGKKGICLSTNVFKVLASRSKRHETWMNLEDVRELFGENTSELRADDLVS